MTVLSSRNALKRRTWALFMFFFLPGLLMASWATRTPAIRDILSVSTAEMGAVLFGLSIGSMSGILCSAWLVKRFGTRKVIRTTMTCAVGGMVILSVALWCASPLIFALGLAVFGASFGAAEVAINVEGAAVERELNKTVLPMMHGFYSFGTLAGAGVGMALTALSVPANIHIILAAAVAIAPIFIAIRAILTVRVKTHRKILTFRKKDYLFIGTSSFCLLAWWCWQWHSPKALRMTGCRY
ncbi:Putative transport protein/putative regulator [Salmonella enterica subsp. enterica]|nr:Putative transport protein/putative regulator [Salmonella enterica subsp. enterica]